MTRVSFCPTRGKILTLNFCSIAQSALHLHASCKSYNSSCLLCISVVSDASRQEMDSMPERCKTYKQTKSEMTVYSLTESDARVIAKLTESEPSMTADWAVQLSNLPFCTILDVAHLLSSLGIVILIIINNNKLLRLTELDSRLAHFSAHEMLGYFWCKTCHHSLARRP